MGEFKRSQLLDEFEKFVTERLFEPQRDADVARSREYFRQIRVALIDRD